MALYTKDGETVQAVQYDPETFYRPETEHEPWVAAALGGPMELPGSCWADLLNLKVGRSDGIFDTCEPDDWLVSDQMGFSLSGVSAADFAEYEPLA